MSIAVEIAVQDAAGARTAMESGADRLELCQALEMGGLTPSLGILESVLDAVDPAVVNVLVRPRGGGFVYDPDEVAVVSADIRASVARGAGGVVVGALRADGGLDREALRTWRDAAGDATLVFHRAIDAAADPDAVFDALVEAGVDRVLTSGAAERAVDGATRLAHFVSRAGDLEVMAGGGVRPSDLSGIRRAGVRAVHLSARARTGASAPSGPGGGAGGGHDATDPDVVRAAVAAARF